MTLTEFVQTTGALAGLAMLLIASSQLKQHLRSLIGM